MQINDFKDVIPKFLYDGIINSYFNAPGDHNNEFDDDIKRLALYIYLRGGKKLYEFFIYNMHFPCYRSVLRYVDSYHKQMIEGKLYFDELHDFLLKRNLPKVVSISEDATKITEVVEYCAKTRTLSGLVAPFNDRTGMPKQLFFVAESAIQISKSIEDFAKAKYVYVIIANPLIDGEFV